jgi:hypothetical protein
MSCEYSSVGEHWPSRHEALGLILSTTINKIHNKERILKPIMGKHGTTYRGISMR